METAQDLAQLLRHALRRPTDGWVVHRHAGHDVRDEPVDARLVKESPDSRHPPSARHPADSVTIAPEVSLWPNVNHTARVDVRYPHLYVPGRPAYFLPQR